MGVGTYNSLDTESVKDMTAYFDSSVSGEIISSFVYTLKNCFVSNIKYIVLYFVLSLSVYSVWACMAIPGIKGFMSGFTSAFLISNYSANGITYVLLSIIPSSLLYAPVCFFASVVCVNLVLDGNRTGKRGISKVMGVILPLTVICGFMTVCSLYDAVISPFIFKAVF